MPNIYAYNPAPKVKNFKTLRTLTLWAGAIGVAQSLIWMTLTIVGIFAYNCYISVNPMLTYGSITQEIFLDLYFKGNCEPNTYAFYTDTILRSVQTILSPADVLIWECVYLAVATCWLISSVLLFIYIKKNNVNLTLGVLGSWIVITSFICLMDAALGIIFGIDYSHFNVASFNYPLSTALAGAIEPDAVQLVSAKIITIALMIISFKGFILWIINVSFVIYFCMEAIYIVSDKDNSDTLFMPRKESDDILAQRHPINAFEETKATTISVGYSNDAFIPENSSVSGAIEVNTEALARAARMSTDVSLQERRFRNLDSFQQYPLPGRQISNPSQPDFGRQDPPNSASATATAINPFPVPDYTPPMMRSNLNKTQQNGGILRNPNQY